MAKNHSLGDLCFDTNGIAGLVFYGLLVFAIVMLMTGHSLPGGALLAVLFIIPLLCIAFNSNSACTTIITGPVFSAGFSNTISFVRIGAFAVSHAAMMEVVMMLAGAESGTPNIIVVIIGNLFVCGMDKRNGI